MLEVGGQDDGLVSGLSGKLDTQVPSVEGDKGKFQSGRNLVPHKLVDAGNGVSEVAGSPNRLVGDCGERSYRGQPRL